MDEGFAATIRLLTTTKNEAAARTLVAGLDSPRRRIRETCLAAIVARRSPAAHREVLRRLDAFDKHVQDIVRRQPSRMADALHDALSRRRREGLHQRLHGRGLVWRVRPDPRVDHPVGRARPSARRTGGPNALGACRATLRRVGKPPRRRPATRPADDPQPRGPATWSARRPALAIIAAGRSSRRWCSWPGVTTRRCASCSWTRATRHSRL